MLLSHLAEGEARGSAARWLLALCAIGFGVTIAALAAMGYGLDRWLFVMLLWGVLIFVPLRILIESSQAFGAGMRRTLAGRIASDPRRYDNPAYLPIAVGALAAREVTLPRICQPRHGQHAIEAAVALISRAGVEPDAAEAMRGAIRTLLVVLAGETTSLSVAATGMAAENIQARWEAARALGTMGALTVLLTAAYADRWGHAPDLPELAGRPVNAYLDAVLDYCDEAALQVDAIPWTEPPITSTLRIAVQDVQAAWHAFLAAGTPAPRAVAAFVNTVLSKPST